MSFSVVGLAEAFDTMPKAERWLSISTMEHHQIRDCTKNDDGSYDLWFYSRPPLTLKQHQATTSTYSLTYVTPVLQNQVSRKATASSLDKGTLIYTADGVFKVHSVREDKIFIKHNGKEEREEKSAVYVEVQTRLGKRLFLYEQDENLILKPLIAHHAILAIYVAPNYSYIPDQFDASHASWIPPLAQTVYDYEAKYVYALGTDYTTTVESMRRVSKVDTKIVQQLQETRSEATFKLQAYGTTKKVYALSRYVTGSDNTKKVTTSLPKVVDKVATVNSTKLKAVIKLLRDEVCSNTQDAKA